MNHFMNVTMDNLRENIGWWDMKKRMDSVYLVYDNTREGSPLRKFVACDAAWRLKRASSQKGVETILSTAKDVADFASDILWAQQKYMRLLNNSYNKGSCPFRRGKDVSDCDFHVAEAGQSCCLGPVIKLED